VGYQCLSWGFVSGLFFQIAGQFCNFFTLWAFDSLRNNRAISPSFYIHVGMNTKPYNLWA